jgi:hypothetical protein
MSIAEFTAALENKANTATRNQATKALEELLKGSTELFNPKSPLSIKSGASILSKDKISVPYAGKKKDQEFQEVNLTETFRAEGEKQGNTALVLTDQDITTLFRQLNVTNATGKPDIQLYINFLVENFGNRYKAKHFELYIENSSGNATKYPANLGQRKLSSLFNETDGSYSLKSGETIKSFRGLNFSHANALTHVASFIHYCRTGIVLKTRSTGLIEVEKEISTFFHRGHILAQTTGRAMASTKYVSSIKDSSGRETNPILLLVELSRQLDIASSGLSGINQELLAAADKDFDGSSNLRMNVGFQLIRSESGTGNLDTGEISTSIALVSTLQSLLDKLQLSQTRTQKKASTVSIDVAPGIKSLDNFIKVFKNFLTKLDKDQGALYKKIGNVLGGTADGSFIANLRSSDSLKDYLSDNLASILKTGKPIPKLKISVAPQKILRAQTKKPALPKLAPEMKKLKVAVNTAANKLKATRLRDTNAKISQTNLTGLQNLINRQLQDVVSANMGDGNSRNVLNYRTGRLASSAKVEYMSESRAGMITAFYSYMKNPYATFSQGGQQQNPRSRDPKLLISKSIREIAAQQVGNRLRAVNI